MDQQKPSSEENKISFHPITEGLGFHPFSDGLPYAPIAKNPRVSSSTPSQTETMGSGAVAAGPPRMVFPNKTSTPVRTASNPHMVPQISVPVAKVPPVMTARDQVSPKLPQQSATLPTAELGVGQSYSFAYLLRRVVAQLLDCSVSAAIFAELVRIWNGGGWSNEFGESGEAVKMAMNEVMANSSVIFAAICLWATFHWLWVTLQEVTLKTSIGKRLLGLKLSGNRFLILLRALFFLPSIGFLGLGIVWSLFDSKKQCWHDRIVDVQPTDR